MLSQPDSCASSDTSSYNLQVKPQLSPTQCFAGLPGPCRTITSCTNYIALLRPSVLSGVAASYHNLHAPCVVSHYSHTTNNIPSCSAARCMVFSCLAT
jgi:hypothetical protein